LPQAGIVAMAVAAYFLVRGATNSAVGDAVRNAHRLVDVERTLGLYHEPALQRDLAGAEAVRTVLNWVYIWGHWPVIVVTLIWLARRHPAVFRRTRNAMMLSGGIGLVLFAAFPVAPPRLAGLGMDDTVSLTSYAYRVLQPAIFTNQYAAMPSLHVGWNLVLGLAVVTAARRLPVRLIGVAMPIAMVVAVVLTANHYILDVVAGAALTTVCWYAVGRLREPGRHRRPTRTEIIARRVTLSGPSASLDARTTTAAGGLPNP
jgi:membrane-associated phospholipid phosphatase